MINVKCSDTKCVQHDVEFTLLGDDEYVRCGGCGEKLEPYDRREDPITIPSFPITT